MFSQSPARNGARVLIVDDHPTIRFGLVALIARRGDMHVCGEAGDLESAWQLIAAHDPDVVVLDLAMREGNGLDLLKRIKAERRRARVLVWSVFDPSPYGERTIRAGANGFITKQEPTDRILEAIRHVYAGGTYPSELAPLKPPRRSKSKSNGSQSDGSKSNGHSSSSFIDGLSDRELQVFQMLGEGLDMARISRQMALSIKTIETYRARIKQKLNCPSRTELVRSAVEWVLRADLTTTDGHHRAEPHP